MVAPYEIRVFGDPVLKQRAVDVSDIDDTLVRLVDDMVETMYAAPGIGLAAPQVGVQKRLFVYDLQDGEGRRVVINPEIVESDGEWEYEEGCLSIPGLSWPIVRPDRVHLRGLDLDGNPIDVEAGELAGRCFQHELDHVDGVLLLERLDTDTRKQAMRTIRNLMLDGGLQRRGPSEHLL